MCGLAGWVFHEKAAKKRRHQTRPLMAALLISNDSRGGHSWGYYLPAEAVLRKGLGRADTMGPKDVATLAESSAAIVHTRMATTGDKTIRNAHPFDLGKVVGAHNGIVHNHWGLGRKYPDRKCEVDSEHLFHHIAEGLRPDDIQAYGAITYCEVPPSPDAKGVEVLVARFNSGQLALAEAKGLGWCWSSDKDHLRSALTLAGIGFQMWEPKHNTLISVTADDIVKVGPYKPSSPWSDRDRGHSGDTRYVSYQTPSGGYNGYYVTGPEKKTEAQGQRVKVSGGCGTTGLSRPCIASAPASTPASAPTPSHTAHDPAPPLPQSEVDTDLEAEDAPDEYDLTEQEQDQLLMAIEIAREAMEYDLGRELTDVEAEDLISMMEAEAEAAKQQKVDEAHEQEEYERAYRERTRAREKTRGQGTLFRQDRNDDEEYDRWLEEAMQKEVGND